MSQQDSYLDILKARKEKSPSYLDQIKERKSPTSYGDSFIDNLGEGFTQGGKALVGGAAKAVGGYGEVFTDAEWTKTIQEWGEEYSKDVPEADGSVGQFIGSLVPSTLPTLGAIATTVATGGAGAPLIAGATAGTLALSSAGSGMIEYEDYKKSRGEEPNKWESLAAGTAYGAAEYLFERLALGRFLPEGTSKKLIGNTEKAVDAGKELLSSWSKKDPKNAAKLVKKVMSGSLVEGGEESLTELSQALVANLYREDQDDFGIAEIGERMATAFAGGALMGTGIGAASFAAQNKMHTDRRKNQGSVVLAEVGGNAEEVINKKGDQGQEVYTTMDATGKTHERKANEVSNIFTLPTDQFYNALKGKVQETEAFEQEEARRYNESRDQVINIFENEIRPTAIDVNGQMMVLRARYKNTQGVITGKTNDAAVFQPTDELGVPMGQPEAVSWKEIQETVEPIDVEQMREAIVPPELSNEEFVNPTKGETFSVQGSTYTVTGFDQDSQTVAVEDEDGEIQMIGKQDYFALKSQPEQPTQDKVDINELFDEEGNVSITTGKETGEKKEIQIDGSPTFIYQQEDGTYLANFASQKKKDADAYAKKIKEAYPKLAVKIIDVSDQEDGFSPQDFRISITNKKEIKDDKNRGTTKPAKSEDPSLFSAQSNDTTGDDSGRSDSDVADDGAARIETTTEPGTQGQQPSEIATEESTGQDGINEPGTQEGDSVRPGDGTNTGERGSELRGDNAEGKRESNEEGATNNEVQAQEGTEESDSSEVSEDAGAQSAETTEDASSRKSTDEPSSGSSERSNNTGNQVRGDNREEYVSGTNESVDYGLGSEAKWLPKNFDPENVPDEWKDLPIVKKALANYKKNADNQSKKPTGSSKESVGGSQKDQSDNGTPSRTVTKTKKKRKSKRNPVRDQVQKAQALTYRQKMMQYLEDGGRIKTEDVRKETGFGSKSKKDGSTRAKTEFNKRIWMVKNTGPSIDELTMQFQEEMEPGQEINIDEQQDIRNEIIDVITSYDSKNRLLEDLITEFSVDGTIIVDGVERSLAIEEAQMLQSRSEELYDAVPEEDQQYLDDPDVLAALELTDEEANKLLQEEKEFNEWLSLQYEENESTSSSSLKSDRGEEKASRKRPKERIDDFGEKLEGARKDLYDSYKDQLEVSTDDLLSQPITKTLPELDYKALAETTDISVEELGILHYFRQGLAKRKPSKNTKRYSRNKWLQQVETYRFALDFTVGGKKIEGKTFMELMEERMDKYAFKEIMEFVKLNKALGFPNEVFNLKKFEVKQFNGREGFTLVNGSLILGTYKTYEEAAMNLKYSLVSGSKKAKDVKFDIVSFDRRKTWAVTKKIGSSYMTLKDGFTKSNDARDYIKNNQESLEKLLTEKKIVAPSRPLKSNPREGVDYRKGKDVTPEQFSDTFGFRGVQFGNYVEQTRRQEDLNNAYDALMDMSEILGIPPKTISLGGNLGLAFGARGKGGKNPASAHFEGNKQVINLTKGNGPGSLAHEWWHALDNYFSRMRGKNNEFLTNNPRQRRNIDGSMDESVRPEVIQAMKGVVDAITNSELGKRSAGLDQRRTKTYWSTYVEMTARSFESYMKNTMDEKGIKNDYLVAYKDLVDYIVESGASEDVYPYPTAEEFKTIGPVYEAFFKGLKVKDGDVLFQKGRGTGDLFSGMQTPERGAPTRRDELKSKMTAASKRLRELNALPTPAKSNLVREEMDALKKEINRLNEQLDGTLNRDQATAGGEQQALFQKRFQKDLFQYLPEVTLDGMDESNFVTKQVMGAFYPQRKQEVQAEVKKVMKGWKNGPKVKVWESVLDFQEYYESLTGQLIDNPYQISGMYWDGDNSIHIVSSHQKFRDKNNLFSSVQNTILHEAVGHHGLRGMVKSTGLQEEFNSLMDEVVDSFENDGRIDAIAQNYFGQSLKDLSKERQRVIAEEFIAHTAETNIDATLQDKIITFLRKLFRELTGSHLKMNDAEIRSLINNSRRFVQVGENNYVPRIARNNASFQKVTQPKQNLRIYGQRPGETKPPREGVRASGARFQKSPSTNSEAFKKWFKDSKVVDENGDPLVVYHGTQFPSFNEFEHDQRNWGRSSVQYFAENSHYANNFNRVDFSNRRQQSATYPVYLSIQNPLDLSEYGLNSYNDEDFFNILAKEKIQLNEREKTALQSAFSIDEYPIWSRVRHKTQMIKEIARKNGYDGIVQMEDYPVSGFGDNDKGAITRAWLSFSPTQIKSATGNNGNFDGDNPDIRFQIVGRKGASNLDLAEGVESRINALRDAVKLDKELQDTYSLKFREGVSKKLELDIPDFRDMNKKHGNYSSKDEAEKVLSSGSVIINEKRINPKDLDIVTTTKEAKIQARTGWFKGKDDKWRYEIDDVQVNDEKTLLADIDSLVESKAGQIRTNLSYYFNHDTLEKAYPGKMETLSIELYYDPNSRVSGYYMDNGTIGLNANFYAKERKGKNYDGSEVTIKTTDMERIKELRRVLTHEFTHLVQYQENFSTGANLDIGDKVVRAGEIYRDARSLRQGYVADLEEMGLTEDAPFNHEVFAGTIKEHEEFFEEKLDPRAIDLASKHTYSYLNKLTDVFPSGRRLDVTARKAYQMAAGEVEARTTAKRLDDKLHGFIYDEDVARKDQILIEKAVAIYKTSFNDYEDFMDDPLFQKQLSIFDVEDNSNVHSLKTTTGQALSYKIYQGSGNETRSNVLQRPEGEGESTDYALIERQFTENKTLDFTGGTQIYHTDDVAYLFKNLEDESIEQVFAVYIMEDGGYVAQHISSGLPYASIADTQGMVGNAIGMKAKKVAFVHNHPSGNLKASAADISIYKKLKTALEGTDVELMPGVIINLRSGKYLQFSDFHQDQLTRPNKVRSIDKEVDVTIHQFNKMVMDEEEYSLATTITSPEQVAKFLSHRRFGKSEKIEALLLNRSNTIVGKISLTEGKMFEQIAAYTSKHSATSVILYGNRPLPMAISNQLKRKLEALDMSMLDYIEVREDGYFSREDGGRVMEDQGDYEPLFQKIKESSPNFYSNSLQSLANISQSKGTFEQWKAMLLKNGASQAELDWIGFNEEFKGKKPTKEEVYNFIQANQIEVVDVLKGESIVVDAEEITERLEAINEKYGVNAYLDEHVMDGSLYLDVEYDGIGIWRNGYIEEEDLPEDFDYQALQADLDPIHKELEYRDTSKDTEYGPGGRHGDFTLPGGENYKELLLTMPNRSMDSVREYNDLKLEYNKFAESILGTPTEEQRTKASELQAKMDEAKAKLPSNVGWNNGFAYSTEQEYKSSHWTEENILSHIRFNERTVDGEKVLFIEELQSDWAQAGRKKGFKLSQEEYDAKLKEKALSMIDSGGEGNTMDDLAELQLKQHQGIPNMPFKRTQDWLNLSMRRMIRYASENGFDRIAWVTGDQSADRYKLSDKVDYISKDTQRMRDESFDRTLIDISTNSGMLNLEVNPETGKVIHASGNSNLSDSVWEKNLEDVIGKELSEKILKSKPGTRLEGLDLEIGGEGMKSFYNKIVPNTTSKLLKKLDKTAKVEPILLDDESTTTSEYILDAEDIGADLDFEQEVIVRHRMTMDGVTDAFNNIRDAEAWIEKNDKGAQQQLSFPITPLIRQKAIQEGMPLFQKSTKVTEDPIIESFKMDNTRLAIQDRYLLMKRLQESKLGSEIDDALNAYQYENLSKGIANDLLDKFKNDHITPIEKLITKMFKQGISYDETQRYLKARHIVDDNIEEGGIPIEEARKIIRDFKKKADFQDVANLERMTQDINQFILQRNYETGLISKETLDKYQAQYKFYVPLRGYANAMEFDTTVYTKDHARKGRTSESGDPLPYLYAMAQTAIQKGQQNLVKQRFLNFVKAVPDSRLYTIKNVWYSNQNGEWILHTQKPPQEIFDKFEVKRNVPVDGMSEQEFADFRTKNAFSKDSISVMVEGKKIVIEGIGEGQKVMRSINNADIDKTPKLLQFLGTYTRRLTKFYTQYSPEFAIRNLIRDMTTGLINVRNDRGSRTAMRVFAEVPGSMNTIRKFVFNENKEVSKEDERIWREYVENGGLTGYSDLKDVADYARQMDQSIDRLKGNTMNWSMDQLEKLLKPIDQINRVFENTVRFSAYKIERKNGKTPEQAAMYAKDLTVNFNRKGNWSNTLSTLYLFFNASTQGIERLVRPFGFGVKNPSPEQKKMRLRAYQSVAMLGSIGLALQVFNRVLGGQDEDEEYYYDKLPSYTRTHNIVIPKAAFGGKEGEFWQIPLPYGYNVFFAVPDHFMQGVMGKEKAHEVALGTFAVMAESFSPLGSPDFSGNAAQGAIQYGTPTIARPVLDLAFNKNFAGNPIYREPLLPGQTPRPDSQMYYKSVNPGIKWITDKLNTVTGGDEQVGGWVDINPEWVEHLISGYGGGAFHFIDNAITTGINVVHEGPRETVTDSELKRRIPFVRNYQTGVSAYYNQGTFYDNVREVTAFNDIYKRYLTTDRKRAIRYRKENLDKIKLAAIAENYEKKVKSLSDRKKRMEKAGRPTDAIDEKLDLLYTDFNSLYNGKKKPSFVRSLLGI